MKRNQFRSIKSKTIFLIFGLILLSIIVFIPNLIKINSSNYDKIKIKPDSEENQINQWFSESYKEQWIKNSEFDNNHGWSIKKKGDISDTNANISEGRANYFINGFEVINYSIISGIPNNSVNSGGWKNTTNSDITVYPTQGHDITKNGLWASHQWAEHDGSNINAYQKTAIQWDKNISLPYNMSDYFISSASFRVKVNASAKAYPGGNYADEFGWQGVEVLGDTYDRFQEGDYIKFYALLSTKEKDTSYRIAEYKTSELGDDGFQNTNSSDYLNDYVFQADNMTYLVFYLNQILEKGDYSNFTISLGMEFNCEDNIQTDLDEFPDCLIKECNFSISFKKKIDQGSSISWNYNGAKIDNRGGEVKIINALLNFKYKVNKNWTNYISPNSELRIYINEQLYSQKVRLSTFDTNFLSLDETGIKVTNLIPNDQEINVSLQIYLADNFNLDKSFLFSVDDVTLDISYIIYLSATQSFYIQLFLMLSIMGIIIISSYIVYYIKIGKYPKAIRKIMRFRKSLKRDIKPSVPIINREAQFKNKYKNTLKSDNKSIHNSFTKISSKWKKSGLSNSYKLIIILLFISLLGFPIISSLHNLLLRSNRGNNLSLSQTDSEERFQRESYRVQWIDDPDFETAGNWTSEFEGDLKDINGNISNGFGNYELIGDKGVKTFTENGNNSGWNLIPNSDNLPRTDYVNRDRKGWEISHYWPDNQPQSLRVEWQKLFNMDVNMSDYSITSATLKAWINGSVVALPVDGGGIDRPGDSNEISTEVQIAMGDFAQFYISISDPTNSNIFEAVKYQTDELGKDNPVPITRLNDTLITPLNEETLIFYLEKALEYNHKNFHIILGMYLWCEDNGHPGDSDNWESLLFKNLTLSIEYKKKIDQFSTISLKTSGNQLKHDNQTIDITAANLNFNVKTNVSWPTSSPNSEFKFFVNGIEYRETIKLSEIELNLQMIKQTGFDFTNLIPTEDTINLTIQVYIADDFLLNHSIKISIDNVELWISYDILLPVEEQEIPPIIPVGISLGAVALLGYFIYYYFIGKYPVPIRKIRKFRKSLSTEKLPKGISITQRENAFQEKLGNLIGEYSKMPSKKSFNSKLKKSILSEEAK